MFLMLVALLLTGMPLAFVTLLVALIFALGWFGPMSIPLITSRVYSFVMNFVFVSVPMFVLMAAILDRSGIARDLFDAMKLFAGRIRGGVAVQTVFVSVILAAMSGIIGGEIVLLGMIALPQMLRLGYDRNLSIGVVCAGGSLGTMIPPSIVLIIYGLTAALYGDISIRRGAVMQSNFHDYKMLRMNEAPMIETHIINGGDKIGGAGEPATPAIAPALANAIFDATGIRVRELPMSKIDFSEPSPESLDVV